METETTQTETTQTETTQTETTQTEPTQTEPTQAERRGSRQAPEPNWQRVNTLFARVADLEPEKQQAQLETLCADDVALREEVEALLAADARSKAWLDVPAVDQALDLLAMDRPGPSTGPGIEGDRIGPYRLLGILGEGGMGTVYRAVRDAEYRQEVALKRIRPGLESRPQVLRFRRERQILADLEHPGIARLIDGGRTADGAPYLVMELVRGEPIDRYCDRRRLTLKQRLELFAKVCRAVHAAHRQRIVHCDLKPSNVLITSEGEPKLLDFGIARLLAPDGPQGSDLEPRALTPCYASPEQVLGQPLTPATDVYALGLLLFELLTGRRAQELNPEHPHDLERSICQRPIEAPSSCFESRPGSTDSDDSGQATRDRIARRRRSEPAALRRLLSGDLDAVVAMAVRKEPEARYASAQALADDLERFLDHRPVHARGDGWLYRSGKLIRRHRALTTLVALLLVSALGFSLFSASQARQTRWERERAEQARQAAETAQLEARQNQEQAEAAEDFLIGTLELPDPMRLAPGDPESKALLDAATDRARDQLADHPEIRARVLLTLGRGYRQIRLLEPSAALLEDALEIRQGLHGEFHLDVAEVLSYLGFTYELLGRARESEALHRRGLAIRRQVQGPKHPGVAFELRNLGGALYCQDRLEEAEPLFRQALALQEESLGPDHPEIPLTLRFLASTLWEQERPAEALPLLERALALQSTQVRDDHPVLGQIFNALGRVLLDLERFEEAEAKLRRALAIRRLLAPNSPVIAETLANLGEAQRHLGRPAEAEPSYREALQILENSLGPESDPALAVRRNLAELTQHSGPQGTNQIAKNSS